jgi:hypothetical protein
MRNAVLSFLSAVLLGAAALAAGCITTPVTSLEVSWVTPQLPQVPFRKLLIITVASDEFVQIAFQDQMAAQLQERGVNAVASRRYFTRYTAAERERFKQSIDDSDADAVLLARVTLTDEGVTHSADAVVGTNGVPYADATGIYGAYGRYYYPGAYAAGGGDYTVKNVTAEASIFTEKGGKLIWSARTRTTNAQAVKSGAAAATQYIAVILDAMKKDKLL